MSQVTTSHGHTSQQPGERRTTTTRGTTAADGTAKADELLRRAIEAGPGSAEGRTLAEAAARRYVRAYRRHHQAASARGIPATARTEHAAAARANLARHLIATNLDRVLVRPDQAATVAQARPTSEPPATGPVRRKRGTNRPPVRTLSPVWDPANLATSRAPLPTKWRYEYLKQVAASAAREVSTFESQILQLMQMAASKAEAAEEMTTPTLLAAMQQLSNVQQQLNDAANIPQDVLDHVKDLAGPALLLAEIVAWLAEEQPVDLWRGIIDAVISDVCSLSFDLPHTTAYVRSQMQGPLHATITGIYDEARQRLDATLKSVGETLHADVAQLAGQVDEEFGKIVSSFDLPIVADATVTGELVFDHDPLQQAIQQLNGVIDAALAKVREALDDALGYTDDAAAAMFVTFVIVPILGMLGVALTAGPLGALVMGALTLAIEELLHLIAGLLVGPVQGIIDDARKKLDAAIHAALAALVSAEQSISGLPIVGELGLLASELNALRAIIPEEFLNEAAGVLGDARDVLLGSAIELARDAERALGLENGTAFNVLADDYSLGTPAPFLPGGSDPMLFAGAALLRDLERLEQARAHLGDGKEFEVVQRISVKAASTTDLLGSLRHGGNLLVDLQESVLVDSVYPGLYRCLLKDIRAYGQLSQTPLAPTSTTTNALDVPAVTVPLTITHLGTSRTRIKPTNNPSAPPTARPFPPFTPDGYVPDPSVTVGPHWGDPAEFADWLAPAFSASNTAWSDSPLGKAIADAITMFEAGNPGFQSPQGPWWQWVSEIMAELVRLFGAPGHCLTALLQGVPGAVLNEIRIAGKGYVDGTAAAAAFAHALVAAADPPPAPGTYPPPSQLGTGSWFNPDGTLKANLTSPSGVALTPDAHGAFPAAGIYDVVQSEVHQAALRAFSDAWTAQDRLVRRWGADSTEPLPVGDPASALGYRRLVRSLPAETAVLDLAAQSSSVGWSGGTLTGSVTSLTETLAGVPTVTQLAPASVAISGAALPTQLSYQLRPFEGRALEGQLMLRMSTTPAAISALPAATARLDDIVLEVVYTACYDAQLAASLGSAPPPPTTSAAASQTVTRVFRMSPTTASPSFGLRIGGTTSSTTNQLMTVTVDDVLANLGALAGTLVDAPPTITGLSVVVVPARQTTAAIASVTADGAMTALAAAGVRIGDHLFGMPGPVPPPVGPLDATPVTPPALPVVNLQQLVSNPATLTVSMNGSPEPYAVLFGVTVSLPAQHVLARPI